MWLNRIGSPPPAGSKNDVLKFRSVKSIVIPPARMGRDRRSRIAVMKIDHVNRVIRAIFIFSVRILIIVVIKLIAPRMDLAPARWIEKITRSTEHPLWAILDERGG